MERRTEYLNARLQGYGQTIFAEMSALAFATGSINLGQGYPDSDGPRAVLDAAISAILAGHNQYPPGLGIPELRSAIEAHQNDRYNLTYDPHSEILVTAGATEAIAASLISLCEIGDEVVMFEPYYDSYAACVAMAGATRRVVPLAPPNWSFDKDQLEQAIGPRTRLIIVNSPHNPTGKVFSHDELAFIADFCVRHDLIAITDEVYEYLVFEGSHKPLATYPGMRTRTVVISSAAKSFSVTGWKVGWACAPRALIAAIRTSKQFLTYVNAAPFQHAIAEALQTETAYLNGIASELRTKRDVLVSGLRRIGFEVFPPAGTFFVTTDIRPLGFDDAMEFCRELPKRCRVVAIPSSVFYDDKNAGRSLVRWTFCKSNDVLEEALERLSSLCDDTN